MSHAAYYNEIDPYAAQWLRNLIAAGHIAPGDVDERSIVDVRPDDLRGYRQCHFFAGIGVWSYALRLAGWADERHVWTGSCPCQPFSSAGQRKGFEDERHLWPTWARLVAQCKPSVVFGEQVAGNDGFAWLDVVQADLEAMDYASGAVVIPAAGVGAPHIRHRLFFVADTDGGDTGAEGLQRSREHGQQPQDGGPGVMGDPASARSWPGLRHHGAQRERAVSGNTGATGLLAYASGEGSQELGGGRLEPAGSPTAGFWRAAEWLQCRDGKSRPVEPGTFPLAHGVAGRVGRLRAYGNAISPHVAAEFIRAYRETIEELA